MVGAVLVGNLSAIGAPGPTKSEIDITDFDSTASEFLMGLPDSGEMTFSGFFNKSNAGQAVLLGDAVGSAATSRAFTITMPGQGAFTLNGFVSRFVPAAGGVQEAVTFDGAVRVTGAVVWTPEV